MLIALDYDKTYTVDPVFWDKVLILAKQGGHDVICCSMRREGEEAKEVIKSLQHKVSKIIFTGRMAKASALLSIDIIPDIWIDDSPFWINNNG